MKKLIITLLLLSCLFAAFAEGKVIMLRDQGPLRIADDSNGVSWSITVAEGTVLELAEPEPVTKDLVTTSGTTPDVLFYHVIYNKKDYYAAASEVVVADNPRVLLDDATLYTKPCIADFRNAILEFGTLVIDGKTVTNNGITFVEVFFYDSSVKTRYVLADKVSTNNKDFKALQMLAKASAEKDRELQLELMGNALSLGASASIQAYLEEQAEIMFSGVTE